MKKLFGCILGLLLALGAAACGGGASSAGGDTLRVGVSYELVTMDPDLLPIQQMWVYLDPVYDSLTRLDGDKHIQPMLATGWTSGKEGGSEYLDMSLREGLSFPDGTPFNADAVLANVTRSTELEGSTNAAWFAGTTVTKVNDLEVRFSSATGVGQIPAILAGPAGMMISPKAIADKTDLTKASAGIGPYSVEAVEPGRVAYTANEDYWNPDDVGAPQVEVVSKADDAMLTALLAGDVQVASALPARMQDTAEKAGLIVSSEPGNVNLLFAINPTIKPLDDPRVREAMSLALDRDEFCQSVLGGLCVGTGQFFGPRSPTFDENIGPATYDLERAKELIKEAGAEGASFEHVIPAGIAAQEDVATYAQAQWAEIGLDVKVTALPPDQVVGRFTQEKNVAVANGGGGLAFDPSIEVGRYMLPESLYNVGKVANSKLDELAKQGLLETDEDARNDIYRQISGLSAEDYILIPVVSQNNNFILSGDVQGWEQPWGVTFNSIRGVTLKG